MPNPGFNWHAERAPLAGFRAWGPATRGANQWTHSEAQSSASPPPVAVADVRQQLIATKRGAVLVMLDDAATPEDVLAALLAAHTQVQRDMLAHRARRAA